MKKAIKFMLIALFAIVTLGFSACKEDENAPKSLVGTWTASYDEHPFHYEEEMQFNKNNTLSIYSVEAYQGFSNTVRVNGTYSVAGDIKEGAMVTINVEDEDGKKENAVVPMKVDGKKLYVNYNDPEDMVVFTKK